jgi:hypothetical protein
MLAATLDDLERVAPALLAHRSATERSVDWNLVRDRLGIALPTDYLAFCRYYGHLTIDDFLAILGPLPGQEEGYVSATHEEMELMRSLADDDMTEGYTFYPEAGGLFPWGSSNQGDMFFWRMSGPDPDAWPAVVYTRNDDWWECSGGMLALLVGLIDGSIEHWGLPPQPGANPTVT